MHPIHSRYYYYRGGQAVPSAPDYASLSNVEGIWDSTGLVANTNNDYGQIGATNQRLVTSWKSLAPGPTGRDMLPIGTFPPSMTTVRGVPVIDNNWTGSLRNTGGSATWNYRHYNATFSNLKWTEHFCLKPGFGPDPNEGIGIIGNNGATAGAKGACSILDDRASVPANRRLSQFISKGTAGFISSCTTDNVVTFGEWQNITFVFDGSLAAGSRLKAYKDKVELPLTVTSASTVVVTTPTHDLEFFACGNGVLPGNAQISHVILQSGVESTEVREAFDDYLIAWANYFNNAPSSTAIGDKMHLINTFTESGQYYIPTIIVQNPSDLNQMARFFIEGSEHVVVADKKVSVQYSTDRGITWSAKEVIFDPVGSLTVQEMQAGWSTTGRLHFIVDQHTSDGVNDAPHSAFYYYSDDEGDNWTSVDITSLIPSDGLNTYRMHGNIIQNAGYYLAPFYKQTDEGDTTESAQYVFKIAVGADPSVMGNWMVNTMRVKGATYINETALHPLSDTKLIAISRHEVTKEFNIFDSTDNGDTWTNQGQESFGEAFTTATPGRFGEFTENGIPYLGWYYSDRSANRSFKAVYAKKSDLITNSLDWDDATKTVIVNDFFHNGNVIHQYGDRRAIGFYVREPNPVTLTNNSVVTFHLPTYHIDDVITTLG